MSTPGQNAFAVITAVDSLEVKVGFSEANAAKVKKGQRGVISFDALPTVAISSTVDSVDAIATSVQNVATYYVTLKVPGGTGQGVKPGMTASVELIVNEATDAVIVQSSAITTIGGRKSVTIRKDGVDTRSVIETGIIGSQGTECAFGRGRRRCSGSSLRDLHSFPHRRCRLGWWLASVAQVPVFRPVDHLRGRDDATRT